MSAELADLLNAATIVGPDDCLVLAFRELTDADFRALRAEISASPLAGRVMIFRCDELARFDGIRRKT